MVRKAARSGAGEQYGYLPVFQAGDPINPAWAGQEATAFPDNWTVGLSFFHNLFVREHNVFVEKFRERAALLPDDDSGLRNPNEPDRIIRYRDVTPEELFQVARLVVAAEIAKIHTIEWTPQLLYNDVMYNAMNANWFGLVRGENVVSRALGTVVVEGLARSRDPTDATQWYSVFASGPGIFGLGSKRYGSGLLASLFKKDMWDLRNPDHVNGGVNHFGSPFNFPEEFVTVYRLHPLVPDLLEYREWDKDPNVIRKKIPVVDTFRGKATPFMADGGLANWGLSLGRQPLGPLALHNHPRLPQKPAMPPLRSTTMGQGSTTAWAIRTEPSSTISRTSIPWSASWRRRHVPTGLRSRRRSFRCSISTRPDACSAIGSSRPVSGQSSIRASASSG